jgi:protein-tyrosine-phosphatase
MAERRLSVLFLCTGNSARSQLAEGILRHLARGRIHVASAGTFPRPEIHPMARLAARRVLKLDLRGQRPKAIDELVGDRFDYVITVCDKAAESCPVFPGNPERVHWSFEDPAAAEGSDKRRQRAFDDTARELRTRIRLWMSLPAIRGRLDSTESAAIRYNPRHG